MRNYSEILFPQNNKTSLWHCAGKSIDTAQILSLQTVCSVLKSWKNCFKSLFIFNSNKFETNRIEFPVHFGSIIKMFFTSLVTRIKGKMWFIDIFVAQYLSVYMTGGYLDRIAILSAVWNDPPHTARIIIVNDDDMNFKKVPQISWFWNLNEKFKISLPRDFQQKSNI